MVSRTFNTTNMFWQHCQDNVVRFERNEITDKTQKALSEGVELD
jgi:hypothetical protein